MNDTFANHYQNKNMQYFSNIRYDIISMIHQKGLKILEIGCGTGATLIELKKIGIASEIVGIEINENSINDKNHQLDKIIIGNIETIELDFPNNYFDAIILGDVLEHLIDPWAVLSKIKNYLNKRGMIIVSIPNIRELYTVFSIFIKGDFRYVDAGILDKTHLRFFCKKNIIDMIQNNFELIELKSSLEFSKSKRSLLNKLTFKLFEDVLTIQYLVLARPIDSVIAKIHTGNMPVIKDRV